MFVEMASNDKSPVVRLDLAVALQKEEERRWDLASNLLNNEEDADDHNIPHMIWFAVEPLVSQFFSVRSKWQKKVKFPWSPNISQEGLLMLTRWIFKLRTC